jgi:glycosyltransferase involved in cell wall biosynthesis
MLRESAIRIKSVKKKIFLKSFRWLGFHKDIHFLAADEIEVNDIRDHFGSATRMTMIPNFPAALPDITSILQKKEGEISLIYIARIHPIKNLDYLLKVLREVRATVRLTVVGSLEDKDFWLVCQEIIKDLPPNIAVDYEGEIRNHLLPAITARHHIFVLPTKGENFGHAIFEALALGKPVLISDQTPWRNLQLAGAGWDLPLDSPGQFGAAIEQAAAFNQDEYEKWCCSTRQYIQAYINRLDLKEEYQKLFS